MERFSTLIRSIGLVCIVVAVAAIVATNMLGSPVVASDYLVRSEVLAAKLAEPASDEAIEVSTLTDWEFTLRGRPAKSRFIP